MLAVKRQADDVRSDSNNAAKTHRSSKQATGNVVLSEALDLSKSVFPKFSLPGVSDFNDAARSRIGRIFGIFATAWATYLFTHRKTEPAERLYPLPEAIAVTETSLPCHMQKSEKRVPASDGKTITIVNERKVVDTKDIDFSKEFFIKTDRYTYDKGHDFRLSRMLGQVFSVPTKLFFFDHKVGAGLDSHEARAVLSMLENTEKLSGSFVRVNHNEVFKDVGRLFTDPKVIERNNLAARIFVGLPTTFFGELFAELRRGDYYNPMTQTTVLYSNVRSIAAHELGHHKDFQRFSSDWGYGLGRSLPPVMLYQEWQASKNAKDSILAKEDGWQFNRYLMPAFCTYLLASYYFSKKYLAKKATESGSSSHTPETPQVVRHIATTQGSFLAGLGAHGLAAAAGLPPPIAAAALLGVWIATKVAADKIMKEVIPYDHEDRSAHSSLRKLTGRRW